MKVLIVEDLLELRELVESTIESWGYEFVSASHGADALELFKTNCFDVVLSDLRMPKMSGLELRKRIELDYGHCPPFILYSGSLNDLKDENDKKLFYKMIAKPFSPGELLKYFKEIEANVMVNSVKGV